MHSHNNMAAAMLKTTAAAAFLWLVTSHQQWLVTTNINNYQFMTEVGMYPGWQSQLWQDSAFFLRIRKQSQKFVKKQDWIQSHFLFSAVAGVLVFFMQIISLRQWLHYRTVCGSLNLRSYWTTSL